jgi:hypothetical protein
MIIARGQVVHTLSDLKESTIKMIKQLVHG